MTVAVTCREVGELLELFVDGELHGRSMREVALHVARCPTCEPELRRLERLQDLLGETVGEQVEEADTSRFWEGVAARLGEPRLSLGGRAWVGARRLGAWRLVPVGAAALAAAAVVAVVALRSTPPPPGQASIRGLNEVTIRRLGSPAGTIALLTEPESGTMLIRVMDRVPDWERALARGPGR